MAKKKAKSSKIDPDSEVKEQNALNDADRLQKNSTQDIDLYFNTDQSETINNEDPQVSEEETQSDEASQSALSEESTVNSDHSKQDQVATKKSVSAQTHAGARKKPKSILHKPWAKIFGVVAGGIALIAIAASGGLGQYYKNRIMPGVVIAGVDSGGKNSIQVKDQLKKQLSTLEFTFTYNEKELKPTQQEIGYQADVESTLKDAAQAKRNNGILTRISFWKKVNVPVSYTVNDTLLNQYLETNLPEIAKPPQDARLQFDSKLSAFIITSQEDGQGADSSKIKKAIARNAYLLEPAVIQVSLAKRAPTITQQKLEPLVIRANELTAKKVVLSGLGYTYQAKPSEIAAWLTPTPQEDGAVKLVVDTAKIQSYIENISKRISNPPVDKKVLKDEATGTEVVIQSGRDGTELAGKNELAVAIADALNKQSSTTQTMNIQTAAYRTVNMSAYDKWIEVDLSEQRTTAYERTTPIRNFVIASGTKGHETVTGEFSIWLKVRKQTMQGGSRADGSYYSIPNVEWVSYFYKDYALHGAWWREKFGAPASHGCVNMTNADAQWVYEWASVGTKVIVHQ